MKAHSVTNHGILLSKLNFYGIGGIKSSMFKSYLWYQKHCWN